MARLDQISAQKASGGNLSEESNIAQTRDPRWVDDRPMTPIEYRQFAADCGRWAWAAKDTHQRDILIHLRYVWEAAALNQERQMHRETDDAALSQTPH